jgi:hypothetical protein
MFGGGGGSSVGTSVSASVDRQYVPLSALISNDAFVTNAKMILKKSVLKGLLHQESSGAYNSNGIGNGSNNRRGGGASKSASSSSASSSASTSSSSAAR